MEVFHGKFVFLVMMESNQSNMILRVFSPMNHHKTFLEIRSLPNQVKKVLHHHHHHLNPFLSKFAKRPQSMVVTQLLYIPNRTFPLFIYLLSLWIQLNDWCICLCRSQIIISTVLFVYQYETISRRKNSIFRFVFSSPFFYVLFTYFLSIHSFFLFDVWKKNTHTRTRRIFLEYFLVHIDWKIHWQIRCSTENDIRLVLFSFSLVTVHDYMAWLKAVFRFFFSLSLVLALSPLFFFPFSSSP